MRSPVRFCVALLTLSAVGFAACSGDEKSSESTAAAETTAPAETPATPEPTASAETSAAATAISANCAKDKLVLKTAGKLSVGTDSPAFEPWFSNDDPANGKGFESAVAYAVAETLGFTTDEVTWLKVPFDSAFAPGDKKFDFDINQVSITEERKAAVDFSRGYYNVNQAFVAYENSPFAKATSIAELKGAKLGAQVNTTSLAFINEVIAPTKEPLVYNTNSDAKSALDAAQIDGIVLDLPTAFFVTAVEIEGAKLVGQFEAPDGVEQFGLVFQKDSPLRACVDEAIGVLETSGQLAKIQTEWLSSVVSAPVLK